MFHKDFVESKLTTYNVAEKALILNDLTTITSLSFHSAKREDAPIYLATAGAPGSGKSTTLETYLQKDGYKHFVYVDPDQMALRNMLYTYLSNLRTLDFATAESNHAALKTAYEKWRDASNYIALNIMNSAFVADENNKRYSIAHGSTSTSPATRENYTELKKAGYKIILLLCYAENDTRLHLNSIRETQQGFVKITSEDMINKEVLFPKRFDLYFEFADEIHFFWNNSLEHQRLPTPCAHYQKLVTGTPKFTVLEANEWRLFCTKYAKDVKNQGLTASKAFLSLASRHLHLDTTHSFLGNINRLPGQTDQAAPVVERAPSP